MTAIPDVSVVVVSWNTRDLTLACVESLAAAARSLRYDVWVVDNASEDDSVAFMRGRFPLAHVIARADNVGFAAANNQGIAASQGRYVLLLNSDAMMTPGSLEALVRFADAHARAGIIGPMLLNPDGTFQGGPARAPSLWSELMSVTGLGVRVLHGAYPSLSARASQRPQQAGYVGGACILARRQAIEQVGPLDEGYFMYAEETDWCWRMWQSGWQVWYTPDARVVHIGSQSTQQRREDMIRALYRSKVRYFRRHRSRPAAETLRATFVIVSHARRVLRRLAGSHPPGVALRWRDLDPLESRT